MASEPPSASPRQPTRIRIFGDIKQSIELTATPEFLDLLDLAAMISREGGESFHYTFTSLLLAFAYTRHGISEWFARFIRNSSIDLAAIFSAAGIKEGDEGVRRLAGRTIDSNELYPQGVRNATASSLVWFNSAKGFSADLLHSWVGLRHMMGAVIFNPKFHTDDLEKWGFVKSHWASEYLRYVEEQLPDDLQFWKTVYGQVFPPGSFKKRTTYLLTWDPDRFPFSELPAKVQEIRERGVAEFGWSTGNATSLSIGERVFLMRQGREPVGLIGAGTVKRGIMTLPHWSPELAKQGRTYNQALISWHALQEAPVLTVNALLRIGPSELWNTQVGGIEIPAAVAEQLEFLLKGTRLAAESKSSPQPEDVVKPSANDPTKFRVTYPLFGNDVTAFDAQSFLLPVRDALGNAVYAQHLAQLIIARKTLLPLSLGLFGDWGSGKSYFMRLLHKEITSLSGKGDKEVFCRKVVQIHFNAWHYLDTNLWANLVSEIFDNLFQALIDRPDSPKKQVESLKKKLTAESALAAEARKALEDAKKAREDSEAKLKQAVQQRQEQEQTVTTFIDDLQKVVANSGLKQELDNLADGFGLTRLKDSFTELESRAQEAHTLAGRFRTLGLTLLSPRGRWQRLSLLFTALLTPVLLACVMPWIQDRLQLEISTFTRSITTAVTLLGSLAAWLSSQTKRGTDLLNKLEDTYEQVKKARAEARNGEKPSQEQAKLEKCIKEEAEAQHVLDEAQSKVRAIESELRELAPGRRLLKFLEQRSGAQDYRQYLGLVSLVRRDFEQLSRLLQEDNEFKEQDGQPMLDRIILYIDDLDRCESKRVIEVLEAVHLLLAFPIFAVVVAVDPRWLRESLLQHYPALLAAGQSGIRAAANQPRESLASPQDYLEKIFQIPFQLDRIEKDGFDAFVTQLFDPDQMSGSAEAKVAPANTTPTSLPTSGRDSVQANGTQQESGPPSGAPVENETKQQMFPDAERPAPDKAVEPPPPKPERLQLEPWELEAFKQCQPLFRTPRAVKRLANTYCLIRTGVEEKSWPQFLGSNSSPVSEYRLPLLMLAVAAAYPGLARRWLDGLVEGKGWVAAQNFQNLPQTPTPVQQGDWSELAFSLKQMKVDEFAPFESKSVHHWLPKVKRYTF